MTIQKITVLSEFVTTYQHSSQTFKYNASKIPLDFLAKGALCSEIDDTIRRIESKLPNLKDIDAA